MDQKVLFLDTLGKNELQGEFVLIFLLPLRLHVPLGLFYAVQRLLLQVYIVL